MLISLTSLLFNGVLMPKDNQTPEQRAVIKDRALYMQMASETYSQPSEVRDALLKQSNETRFIELEKLIKDQGVILDGLKGERDKALRWGIIALGTAVMGMGSWIVNLFTAGHIR